ncbi:MAG: purine-nucleoside phosphorylase [Bacteriovoracaceae bacterium]|nr:purine-nucleoside phosphorylase [Bacteriovoracaceae bacterium]
MSIHIGAKAGQIASTVLLPGDPLRAKFLAENYLEDVTCYNNVRGMYGYTGSYQGTQVSVQGTGMGLPSIAIYVSELITEYKVKKLIRVGSCGSLQKEVKVRDIVLAQSSSTDSSFNKLRFNGMDYAPTADFNLLNQAYNFAKKQNMPVHVGNILSSDNFYNENPDAWKLWAQYGALAVEMETTALYTLAAKYKVCALSVLTVSDSLATGESTSSSDREKTFGQMMEVALSLSK